MADLLTGLRATAAALFGPQPQERALTRRRATKAAYDLVPMGVQGRAQYPATDPAALLATYARNELVYACINRRAASAIGPRLIVQARPNANAEWVEQPGHPFRRLWMRPNPGMDSAAFLKAVIVSKDISGRFFGEIVRSPAKLPVAIYPLNPALVGVIPGAGNTVGNYEFRQGTTRVTIAPTDMLAESDYDPANPAWGALSRLAVCLGTVDADNAQTDFVRAYFNNAGVPSGILKIKGTLTPEMADVHRARWREKFGRTWGAQHDVAVMDDSAEYQQIGANLDQLDSEIMRSIFESRIAMTFEVPPLIIYAYVGLLRATYSNLKEAWASFWDATLTPMYEELRVWLEWNLLTQFVPEEDLFAERIRLAWDFSAVPAKQDDESVKHSRAKDAFVAGGLTLNEYRARLGEQPDPAGDYYLRTLAQVEVPATTSETPKGLLPGGRAYKGRVARDRSAIERHMETAAAAYLEEQYARAAAAVEAD